MPEGSEHAGTHQPGLLGLPREIRDRIWELSMDDGPETFTILPGMEPSRFFYPGSLPPMAFVQRFLFNEIFLAWLRWRMLDFHFSDMVPSSFVHWMDTHHGQRGWANIKSLKFNEPLKVFVAYLGWPYEFYNAASVVMRATTLRHLTLAIRSLSVVHFDARQGEFTRLKTIDEILLDLDFRSVFHCRSLQSLKLLGCPTWRKGSCIEAEDLGCRALDLFVPLCDWFQWVFISQSQSVDVVGKLHERGRLPNIIGKLF